MKNESILITGASGFLGTHLSESIRSVFPDSQLTLCSGRGDNSRGILPLDLTDFDRVSDFISQYKPTTIFHLGGPVDLSRSYEVATSCIEGNLVGTTNLLEAIKGLDIHRFLYASTEEVYGTTNLPYRESDSTTPPSPYAITKLACEHMCRIYAQQYSMPTFVFRIGTMYGPKQPGHRYIVQTILKAIAHEPIPLNSGKKKRDYVFVTDIVDALLLASQHTTDSVYELFNLGGSQTVSLRELVETIVQLAKSNSILRIGEIPDRISEVNEWRLDSSKAKNVLGWETKTDLVSGLLQTIDYYKNL